MISFNFCLLISAIFIVGVQCSMDDLRKIIDECKVKFDVSDSEMDVRKKMKDFDPDTLPENMLCFHKCIEEGRGSIDADGTFHPEKFLHKHLEDLLKDKEGFMSCIKKVKTVTDCKSIIALPKCIKEFINDSK